MSGGAEFPARGGARGAPGVSAILLLVGLGGLGMLSRSGPVLGLVAVLAPAIPGVILVGLVPSWPKAWGSLLGLTGLVLGTAMASLSPLSELAAGVAGLALVYWAAAGRERFARKDAIAATLALPAASTGIAIATSLLLPRPDQFVGVAAGLAVGVFLYLAWVLSIGIGGAEEAPAL